jgi:serine protease SohB
MSGIHDDFIALVKESRGDKLTASDDVLFNGDYWRGNEAVALGLIDKVTTVSRLLAEEFGTDNVIDYSSKPGMFEGLIPKIEINVVAPKSTSGLQALERDLTL